MDELQYLSATKHRILAQSIINNKDLHFIPEASHLTFKVLLAARLHGFLLYSQKLDLRQNKRVEEAGTEVKNLSGVILVNTVAGQRISVTCESDS